MRFTSLLYNVNSYVCARKNTVEFGEAFICIQNLLAKYTLRGKMAYNIHMRKKDETKNSLLNVALLKNFCIIRYENLLTVSMFSPTVNE